MGWERMGESAVKAFKARRMLDDEEARSMWARFY